MPRRPDLPCAGCGNLMWRGKGVLPEGQATCRSCRSSAHQSHGTRLMYRERGCRCVECRTWAADQIRAYNSRVRDETGLSYWQARRPCDQRRSPGTCSKCGKGLAATASPSPVCALCRGNRPGYNIGISRTARLAIYQRDGWVCQICTEPVDPAVPPNSTWGATLDHVTPRSRGGSNDPANLRLAHRWCNSVRGDLSHYADNDLRMEDV